MGISFLNSRNINGFSNISNINKVNSNFTRPVSFKGINNNDTVELSSNAQRIREISSKIEALKAEKAQLETDYEEAQEKYNTANKEFHEAYKKYGQDDERTKELQERLSKTKRGKAIKVQINKTKIYIKKLEKYLEAIKSSPNTAFLYDPDTTLEEKEIHAQNNSGIKNVREFAKDLGIPVSALDYWSRTGAFDAAFAQNDKGEDAVMYIDLNSKKNLEFFDSIKDKLQTSLSGEEINKKYTIAPETMRRAVKNGKLKTLGTDVIPEKINAEKAMYDMEDETNKRYFRGKTYHDQHYFGLIGKPNAYIPAKYLEKMGYATASFIRKNIQAGLLPGKIEVKETPDGKKYRTLLDVSDYLAAKDFLKIARDLNHDVATIQDLAKELGIKQGRIKYAIEEGEAEILNEYLITEENGKIYLKRSNPKNALFIEKAMFEKTITEELRAKEKEEKQQENIKRLQGLNKDNSLRMKLARNIFCPHTREVASGLAKQDGHLCKLLIKDSDNKEELTTKEEIKVNSYRKKMWDIAGTDELSSGLNKAQEYIDIYHERGLEAIDNEEIKEIIKLYYPE